MAVSNASCCVLWVCRQSMLCCKPGLGAWRRRPEDCRGRGGSKIAREKRQAALTQRCNLPRDLQSTVDDQRADIRAALDLVSFHQCLSHHPFPHGELEVQGQYACLQLEQAPVNGSLVPRSHPQQPQSSGWPRHCRDLAAGLVLHTELTPI